MTKKIGIRYQAEWILMDYISLKHQEIECTLNYLTNMLNHLATLQSGLLNIKLQLFLPLLLAPQGRLPAPPKIPGSPHPSKKRQEFDLHKWKLREALVSPHLQPRIPDDDEEEEKENLDPERGIQEPNEENPTSLSQVLKKWEADIDRFRNIIYHDLEDFKKTLGIHQ
ncbi:E4 [Gammapapillomavirus sp.]|uniref:E4 n=1 Tax=Gammapapillomavirus sp. TaxID=2049444 RepID=UPI000C4ED3E6|nr:E4 [Gammapapillomavirus sp.]ATQ38179.1 E4 [Gammapapillomavirus sp.]